MRKVLLAVMLITLPAAAQFSNIDENFDKNYSHVDISIRLGALNRKQLTLNGSDHTLFSGGGAISFSLGQESVTRRLSVRVVFEVVSRSSDQFFDPNTGSEVRFDQSLFFFNSSIGFDVIQTSRFDLTVHYGGALTVDETTFLLEDAFGDFENVCDFQDFSGSLARFCPTRTGFLGNGGAGFRVFPKKNGRFFLGMDYTRFAGGINQTVGTFGWAF